MNLTTNMRTTLETAEGRALATTGPHGINVVPVSVITLTEAGEIYLYDFFMDKTVTNLTSDSTVALSAWSGLAGIQVKATAAYETAGERFAAEEVKMKAQFPDRTLRGVIILTPSAVYDISAGATAGQKLM
jgi:hypothetical protein